MINRRSILVGLITAPAIVRANLIMPIKVIEPARVFTLADYEAMVYELYRWKIEAMQKAIADHIFYGPFYQQHRLAGLLDDNTGTISSKWKRKRAPTSVTVLVPTKFN